jgi:alanyl-tRNA synthetase
MSGVNEIRNTFLDYFGENEHEIVSSSPLVPRNDPTLMFTNAGMVQFKNVFTGQEKRDYSRAVTSQKCVRAGGKHNDLDNVGYTARHHTFFEMLGNFSFGDYFKDTAIELAWNLVTKEFGLPQDKLLVTVYSEDDEAFQLWRKIAGLSDDRIIRIPTSDNFWAMGDTGPCGPCSEIFYDHGDHIPGGPPGSPDEDGDRFIEIWNLVFMQYEQITADQRVDLPRPSIDTGMGLERISAVLQGTHDNYETDLMRRLIEASVDATGVEPEEAQGPSHRVIADHLRASAFLIADGVLPSNEGRGYVLRRIMRRAMRHAELLGVKEPLMYRLVPTLTREMGQAYGELVRAQALITETLKLEEERFRRTLSRGLVLLNQEESEVRSNTNEALKAAIPVPNETDQVILQNVLEANSAGEKIQSVVSIAEGFSPELSSIAKTVIYDTSKLAGDVAFKLYDTYGFPLDLTQDALRARGIEVDTDGFASAMEAQKAEARKAWAGSGEAASDRVWFEIAEKVGATEFLGYETDRAEGVITAIVRNGQSVDQLGAGESGILIVNQTPFYGESGGQVGDTGSISCDGAVFAVSDTQKQHGGVFGHSGILNQGTLKLNDPVEMRIDVVRRDAVRANHSATHLIHEALRQIIGPHVAQKGSLVAPDRLRFDFSNPKPVSGDELILVEAMANAVVQQNAPVSTRLMAVDDAIEAGAMALFGEKYGDEVRVVSMGEPLEGQSATKPYSLELCGGTHVGRTGDVGVIALLGEAAVSSGVRRVEALSGEAARQHLAKQDRTLREIASKLKAAPDEIGARIDTLVEERRKLERQLAEVQKQLAIGGVGSGGAAGEDIEQVNGIAFTSRVLDGVPPKDLKGIVDGLKQQVGSGVVAVVTRSEDGKAGMVVGVTGDLTSQCSAVDLVRAGSEALGGKGGGGRPDMAQAGGPDAGSADVAIDAVRNALQAISG